MPSSLAAKMYDTSAKLTFGVGGKNIWGYKKLQGAPSEQPYVREKFTRVRRCEVPLSKPVIRKKLHPHDLYTPPKLNNENPSLTGTTILIWDRTGKIPKNWFETEFKKNCPGPAGTGTEII